MALNNRIVARAYYCHNLIFYSCANKEESDTITCDFIEAWLLLQRFQTLTLCLDNNIGMKRKERKEKGGEGKEGKRNERKVSLVCLGGKRREREGDGVSLQIFSTLEKLIP